GSLRAPRSTGSRRRRNSAANRNTTTMTQTAPPTASRNHQTLAMVSARGPSGSMADISLHPPRQSTAAPRTMAGRTRRITSDSGVAVQAADDEVDHEDVEENGPEPEQREQRGACAPPAAQASRVQVAGEDEPRREGGCLL